jgi:hypothetical protein
MTLAELLAANADAQAEFDTAISAAVAPLTKKQAELLGETKAAKQTAKELQAALAELGDIDGLKKIKSMFEQNEELKLFAEGKHDEVFAKRTEKQRADFEKQLNAATAERDGFKSRAAEFEQRALDSQLIEAMVGVQSIDPRYKEDILLHGRNKFTLDAKGNAIALHEDEIVLGKDGKTPFSPMEWLSNTDETGRWHKASGGAGAQGNSGSKTTKTTVNRATFESMTPAQQHDAVIVQGLSVVD